MLFYYLNLPKLNQVVIFFSLLTALAIITIIYFLWTHKLPFSLPVVLTAGSVSGVEGLNSGTD